MSTTQFSSPGTTQGVDWEQTKGHLLLITPLSVEEKVKTILGEKDAVRADVVDLDAGEEYTDVLVFPRVLQGQLRSRIGQRVLGRLGQGTAKPGQSPPWVLEDFAPRDAKKATAWVEQHSRSQFARPDADSDDDDAPF